MPTPQPHVFLLLNAPIDVEKIRDQLRQEHPDNDGADGSVGNSTIVVCADGGLALAQLLGLRPQILIGDFDSVKDHLRLQELKKHGTEVVELSVDKDATDGELALLEAIKRYAPQQLTIIGLDGGRFDMVLANLALLLLPQLEEISVEVLLSTGQRATLVTPQRPYLHKCHPASTGDVISLMALSDHVRVKRFSGVVWELHEADIYRASTRTVSNRINSNMAEVVCLVETGRALIIR